MSKINITSTTAPSSTTFINKGTQADHHITDNSNHTQPIAKDNIVHRAVNSLASETVHAAVRVKNIAREARDVPTAVGTALSEGGENLKAKVGNIAKQVAEVGKVAITNHPATTSDKIKQPSNGVKIVDPNTKPTTQKGTSRQSITVNLSPIRKTTSK